MGRHRGDHAHPVPRAVRPRHARRCLPPHRPDRGRSRGRIDPDLCRPTGRGRAIRRRSWPGPGSPRSPGHRYRRGSHEGLARRRIRDGRHVRHAVPGEAPRAPGHGRPATRARRPRRVRRGLDLEPGRPRQGARRDGHLRRHGHAQSSAPPLEQAVEDIVNNYEVNTVGVHLLLWTAQRLASAWHLCQHADRPQPHARRRTVVRCTSRRRRRCRSTVRASTA